MSFYKKQIQAEMEDEKKGLLKELGSRIRSVRLRNNLTKAEFALALMVRMKTLSEIENGERQPGGRLLFALEEYFGINGIWLITGKGGMLRESRDEKMENTMRLLGMFSRLSERNRDKILNITKMLMQTEYVNRQKRANE